MELTQRQKKILRAVVDCYVDTAEPVGSKTIAAMPGMDFSSATIRNELAALTEDGLLEQPHTSAGRVPSPARRWGNGRIAAIIYFEFVPASIPDFCRARTAKPPSGRRRRNR